MPLLTSLWLESVSLKGWVADTIFPEEFRPRASLAAIMSKSRLFLLQTSNTDVQPTKQTPHIRVNLVLTARRWGPRFTRQSHPGMGKQWDTVWQRQPSPHADSQTAFQVVVKSCLHNKSNEHLIDSFPPASGSHCTLPGFASQFKHHWLLLCHQIGSVTHPAHHDWYLNCPTT